jgi:hypothetical protein
LDSSYGWQLSSKPRQIVTASANSNAYWSGACDNWPTASQSGWVGTQEVAFAPTENFRVTSVAPGYTAPWSTTGQMVMFADAASAASAFTAVEKLNDSCPAGLIKQVSSVASGRSRAMSWNGPSPIQAMRTYAVQRGSVIMVLQLVESDGQAPAYDGGQDTAVLDDIAQHLCDYAGACA